MNEVVDRLTDQQRQEMRNCQFVYGDDANGWPNRTMTRPWSQGQVISCPWSWPDSVWDIVHLWERWKLGTVLVGKDLGDLPAWIGQAVETCEASHATVKLERMREAEAEQRALNRKAAKYGSSKR